MRINKISGYPMGIPHKINSAYKKKVSNFPYSSCFFSTFFQHPMSLDYSKWDNLEISDDSDIEVHPNVDKRSMIKWKQEAIHRERAERKAKIEYLTQFVPQQQNVLAKVQHFSSMLRDNEDASKGLELVVQALDKQQQEADPGMMVPSPTKEGGAMNVTQVFAAMKAQIAAGLAQSTPEEVKKTLLERFDQTAQTVQKTVNEASNELAKLNAEAKKKMTSENMFTSEKSNKTVMSQ
jgi:cell division cycle protein 37